MKADSESNHAHPLGVTRRHPLRKVAEGETVLGRGGVGIGDPS